MLFCCLDLDIYKPLLADTHLWALAFIMSTGSLCLGLMPVAGVISWRQ